MVSFEEWHDYVRVSHGAATRPIKAETNESVAANLVLLDICFRLSVWWERL